MSATNPRCQRKPHGLVRLVAGWWTVSLGLPATAVDLQLPPDAHGTYAPGGDCARQPRVLVDKDGVHLDTARGQRRSLPILVSYTFVGGARYSGIQTWAMVKHGGKDRWGEDKTPVLLTFNANERRGALSAERNEGANEPRTALDGPLDNIVQTGRFRLCRGTGRPVP